MSIRGKETYIITAVIAVIAIVAWWFLLFNPKRGELNDLNAQYDTATQTLATAQQDLLRLESYKKVAPQTKSDLLRLNKMMPSETGIPSIIVELTKTAEESGLDFVSIQPSAVAPGTTFSVEPLTLTYSGLYYDVEDFLFRLESYVEYRNDAFIVTGRLLQVAQIAMSKASSGGTEASDTLTVSITVNCYIWSGQQLGPVTPAASAVITSPTPTPTATPTPGQTTPVPLSTGVATPTPSGTVSP